MIPPASERPSPLDPLVGLKIISKAVIPDDEIWVSQYTFKQLKNLIPEHHNRQEGQE